MKNTISLLALAGAALLAAPFGTTNAQTVGDDGVAASPRMRQILNERSAVPSPASARDAGYKVIGDDGIAASPKMRQMLSERPVAVGGTGGGVEPMFSRDAGYKAVGDDGIAASPKMRQILDGQKPRFEIAPLK